MLLSDKVLGEIDQRFPAEDREAVRAMLAACRSEEVCIAILRLCRGKISRIETLIEAARRDYRDVLAWAQQPTRTYIVGLLHKGPLWGPEDENGRTHLEHASLRKWRDAGQCLVGGWFMDFGDPRGMYIFTVDSVEEARSLVQEDPAIQSEKLVFEFHPWLAPDGLKFASPDEL